VPAGTWLCDAVGVSELWRFAAARRREFDAAALDYDRYRPRYPAAIHDELISLVPGHDRSAIEIGAGTGIATVPLVERGLRVLAIEPSRAMAEVLTAKLDRRVEVVVGRFEDWVPDRQADLVVAFNAWHWVDPAVTIDHVADVLRPGGVLGLVWTEVVRYGPPVLEERLGLHPDGQVLRPIVDSRFAVDADGRFEPPALISHEFSRALDADAYVAVTRTYGGPHTAARDAAIRSVIEESCEGTVTKTERADLYAYRRSGRARRP
jgi:SAM-dependent methyltransferase